MLNMIRMEMFRMFKTKSLYVIWIVLFLGIGITSYFSAVEFKEYTMEEKQEMYEYAMGIQKEEIPNLGMSVTTPTKPGEDVSVFDLFYANLKGKFIALFMVIFTVLYTTADLTSGYVKNIAGQVGNRAGFIFAKAVSLFVYTILTFVLLAGIQAISNGLFFGKIVWGAADTFLKYAGIQMLLHFALLMIVMCVAIILRSNVISMTFAVCLCMNVLMIFYGYIDRFVTNAGVKNFQLMKYTVSGRISLLPMEMTIKSVGLSMAVSIGFILITLTICSTVFKKRDI